VIAESNPVLPKYAADGSLTIYVQRVSPGPEKRIKLIAGAARAILDHHPPLRTEARSAQRRLETT
jgi:hypothetical protein